MIDLKALPVKRPYLYHLTHRSNLPYILSTRTLFCASELFRQSGSEQHRYLRARRSQHVLIEVDRQKIQIRDQRPISEKALSKCLEEGLQAPDYYEILNQRVFMWATVERLDRHYQRYASERPVLLRFLSEEIIRLNQAIEFSRLNSGATRPNSHLGGIAPRRGRGTFQRPRAFEYGVSKIVEVTFPDRCVLPREIELADTPEGPWLLAS